MAIRKLYRIGEVMEYSDMSRQTIHNYTQLDLIRAAKRTKAGHRLYDEEVFSYLTKIRKLKTKGYTLLEIKRLLKQGRRR